MSQPSAKTCRLVDRRDNWRCIRCGKNLEMVAGSRHHRRLRSHPWPGLHLPSNLVLLCGSGGYGLPWLGARLPGRSPYRRLHGACLGIPQSKPIYTKRHEWVLLDDEGEYQLIDMNN